MYLAASAPDGARSATYGGLYGTSNGGRTWKRYTNFPSAGPGYVEQQIINAVAADPRNSADITVGAEAGGVYRSRDGGKRWSFDAIERRKTTAGPLVWSLAYGPAPSYFLWAGSVNGAFRRSPDGSWRAAGLPGQNVYVVPDARLPQVAFAFPQYGGRANRTFDGGEKWQPMKGLPDSITGISVQADTDVAYAWTARTIYRSFDHGASWSRLPKLPG